MPVLGQSPGDTSARGAGGVMGEGLQGNSSITMVERGHWAFQAETERASAKVYRNKCKKVIKSNWKSSKRKEFTNKKNIISFTYFTQRKTIIL